MIGVLLCSSFRVAVFENLEKGEEGELGREAPRHRHSLTAYLCRR